MMILNVDNVGASGLEKPKEEKETFEFSELWFDNHRTHVHRNSAQILDEDEDRTLLLNMVSDCPEWIGSFFPFTVHHA